MRRWAKIRNGNKVCLPAIFHLFLFCAAVSRHRTLYRCVHRIAHTKNNTTIICSRLFGFMLLFFSLFFCIYLFVRFHFNFDVPWIFFLFPVWILIVAKTLFVSFKSPVEALFFAKPKTEAKSMTWRKILDEIKTEHGETMRWAKRRESNGFSKVHKRKMSAHFPVHWSKPTINSFHLFKNITFSIQFTIWFVVVQCVPQLNKYFSLFCRLIFVCCSCVGVCHRSFT